MIIFNFQQRLFFVWNFLYVFGVFFMRKYIDALCSFFFPVDYKKSFASWASSVDYAFENKTEGTIANGDIHTVEYLLRKVMDSADRQLWMFSKQLGNDYAEKSIFSEYEFLNSVDLFLRKNGSVFNIAILNPDYKFDDPFWSFLEREGFLDKVRIFQLREDNNICYPHFLVNDRDGFRFEKHSPDDNGKGRKAFGRAHCPEDAKKLINYFRDQTKDDALFRRISITELKDMVCV